jgi:hypothetical protein
MRTQTATGHRSLETVVAALLVLTTLAGSGCDTNGTAGSFALPLPGAGEGGGQPKACCTDDSACQDDLYCNGRETCNCWGGCEPSPGPIRCNDGNACTRDWCDETRNTCRFTSTCHDGNVCTQDICNADGTCTYPNNPLGFPCDDALFCTAGSQCNGVGTCLGTTNTPCQASPNCPQTACDDVADVCGCSWTEDGDYGRGTFTGVSLNPSNPLHPDCTLPGNICLDSSLTPMRHIWVPNSDSHTLAKINVDTGALEPGFPRASLGHYPSRTVVDAHDQSVWLGNRGWDVPTDGELSNVVHFAADGSVLCRKPLPGMVRALAIDMNGDVWAGLWQDMQIVKISGTLTDAGAPYPVCRELLRIAAQGRPYGAAGDAFGNVWFANNADWAGIGFPIDANRQSLLKVPIANPALAARIVPTVAASVGGCFNTYGIAVDAAGQVWIGSYACATVIRYSPATNTWSYRAMDGWGRPRGVAFDAAGVAYVALSHYADYNDWNHRVARIVPQAALTTATLGIIDIGANYHPVGTAIDYVGRVWTVERYHSNNACRINVSAWPAYTVNCFGTGGADPYAYTDMTGMQNLLFTSPTGTWIVNMDSGSATARWSSVLWTGREVAGVTDISVRARTAPTQAGLATGVWSSSYTNSPAPLATDPTIARTNRWIQLEVTLTTNNPSQTPVLYDIQALWTP